MISEFSIAVRVPAENSWSSPRSSVTLATMATRIAGTAATIENKRDDAHVQACRGAARAARLHHLPDLAGDDADQQQHRRRVGEQQRHHDVVGRQDRREIGEHDEGEEGRQQREADRDRAQGCGFRRRRV